MDIFLKDLSKYLRRIMIHLDPGRDHLVMLLLFSLRFRCPRDRPTILPAKSTG